MKKGDKVRISPDITLLDEWVDGVIIEIENNRFNGSVITAETPAGAVYFGPAKFFEPVK